ncbi:hypothetical protein AALB53_04975 [Lachnospiraceae bacterium 47-T17]
MTKTVGPPERPREPEQVRTGTITRALNITSERQAENAVLPVQLHRPSARPICVGYGMRQRRYE